VWRSGFRWLHAPMAKTGTIPGPVQADCRCPFVGSGLLRLAVGMDKQAMIGRLRPPRLPSRSPMRVQAAELEAEPDTLLGRLERQLGYPCFVSRPTWLSVGTIQQGHRSRRSLLEGCERRRPSIPSVVEQG